MPQCTNCNYRWKVKEIWSLGFSKNGKDCHNCGVKQYISTDTQKIFSLGYLSLVFILIFPFIIKLSDKEEPSW
jgi:CXXC-20-CXXC protein